MVSSMPTLVAASLLSLWLAAAASDPIWTHPARPSPDPLPCGEQSGVACPVCPASTLGCSAGEPQRVRRAWTTLTDAEKEKFISAMHTMKWTGLAEGQAVYGSQFRNYDFFVHWHSTFANNPAGDIGHLGMHFALVHKALILAFENSLLAVDPSIGGVPYWDQREHEGFLGPSPLQFGSPVGTGPSFSLQDGAFANWTVSPLEQELYESRGLAGIFTGNNFTGAPLLRTSNVNTTSLVRFPKCGNAGPMTYSEADYAACRDATRWVEWNWCVESADANAAHEFAHFWLGSASGGFGFQCENFSAPHLEDISMVLQGDFIDKSTSPNDPAFFLLHSFVDMNHVEFQLAHPEGAETYWDYQAAGSPVNGTNLMEVLSDRWPFVGAELLKDPGAPQGSLTAWEVACWLRPGAAPYTYDKVLELHCGSDADGNRDSHSSLGPPGAAPTTMAFAASAAALVATLLGAI